MLSGYMAGLSNAGSLMAGAAYVPWALATLAGKWDLRQKVLLLGCLIALQALTGDPQSVLFSALALAAFVAWSERRKSGVAVLVGGFALAGLLAAVQLLPAWYLLGESNRAAVNPRFFEQFAFHPVRLLELFAPRPLGGYLVKPHFWAAFAVNGPGIWPFALSAYMGAASATVALLGAGKDRRTGFGVSLLVIGILLALGPHGPLGPVLLFPPLRFFRYPEKYLLLASLGMAALVSHGIDRLRARQVSGHRLAAVAAAIFVFAAVIATAIIVRPEVEGILGSILRRVAPRVQVATALATLLDSGLWALACAVAVWLSSLLAARSLSASSIAIPAIGCVVGLDLLFAAQALIFTTPIVMFRRRPEIVAELNRSAPARPYRYMRDWSQARTFDRDAEESYLRLRDWELETLKSNLGGVFGLEEVGGYAGGFSLRRWEEVALALHQSPSRLAALFNGCLALATAPDNPYGRDPHFKRAAFESQSQAILYENELCQGRLRTVSHVLSAPSLEIAVRMVAAPQFELGSQAVVEGMGERLLGPAQVSRIEVRTRRASAEVSASTGGSFVLFATSYYPGWTARVDGRLAALKIVNGATMGVEVPEGIHRVEFEFSDPGVRLGFGVTAAGLVIAIGFAVFGQRGRSALQRQSLIWNRQKQAAGSYPGITAGYKSDFTQVVQADLKDTRKRITARIWHWIP
jgi:hypothetical protein